MDAILTINGGSSSIKFALFDATDISSRLLSGEIQRVGQPGTVLNAKGLGEEIRNQTIEAADSSAAVEHLVKLLRDRLVRRTIAGIGHRVVHGGLHLIDHQIITANVLDQLREATEFDAAHLPREIALIEIFAKHFPDVKQVACFDSAFHKDLPTVAKMLPIPRKYFARGVHRLGFHGLSYAYLMQELRSVAGDQVADGKVIIAHLGSGASLAAVRNGKPIDTSMAFTPTAGIVMGTRPGDLDPGLLVYLLRSEKMSADQIDEMLNRKCGLLGVSDTSSDMRDLTSRRNTDPRAAEAVDLFCYSVKRMIGAYAAALGGIDTLVFSGGIGEHSSEARAGICAGLEFLGIKISPDANTASAPVISAGQVFVRVIATDEEAMIAHTVLTLVH
jgi:acetate kinase